MQASKAPGLRRAAQHLRGLCTSPTAASPTLGELRERISLLIRLGSSIYLLQTNVLNTTMSIGPSMQPTLNASGDILLTEYLTPRHLPLRRHDVVVCTKPTSPHVSILKRVQALPGEPVRVHDAQRVRTLHVPPGHVWLEGDNKMQSTDSRQYGPVPLALVRGRVVARFWPLRHMCWMRRAAASADCDAPDADV